MVAITQSDMARAEAVIAEMQRQSTPASQVAVLAEALRVERRLGELAGEKVRAAEEVLNQALAEINERTHVTEASLPARCIVAGTINADGGVDDIVAAPLSVKLDAWGRREAAAAILDSADSLVRAVA